MVRPFLGPRSSSPERLKQPCVLPQGGAEIPTGLQAEEVEHKDQARAPRSSKELRGAPRSSPELS
eukprot:12936798-Alexandrium_andersonii.AAC.1